jgi:hypothetical protein
MFNELLVWEMAYTHPLNHFEIEIPNLYYIRMFVDSSKPLGNLNEPKIPMTMTHASHDNFYVFTSSLGHPKIPFTYSFPSKCGILKMHPSIGFSQHNY